MVLSAFHLAPVNGVARTMMITGKTVGASSVVNPHGRCTFYIIYRAQSGTEATLDAGILIYPELFVVDEVLGIIGSDDV